MPSINISALTIYKRLLTSVKPYLLLFIIGIAGTAAVSCIDAAFAWLIKPIINQGFIARDKMFIQWLPLGIVAIFILRGITVFLSNYFIAKVGRNVVMDFRQQLFQHMLRLPASFYDGESSGQLLSRLIYNVEQVAEASTYALLIIVQEGVLAIGLLVVMFSLSWQLTLLFMIIGPIIVWVVRITSKRLRRLSQSVQKSVAEVSHITEESIEGYKVIRTFGGENYEIKKFFQATFSNRQRELKIVATNAIGTSSVQILISIAIAVILFLATLPKLEVSAGAFAALIAAMFTLLRPIRRINQVNGIIQKGVAGAQSIFELLDEKPEQDTGTLALKRAKGSISYQDVSFSYATKNKPVLNQINFHINAGETIALVGRSGGGKSTLVSLLPRFYEIESGSIAIDGTNIRHYRLADLRDQFALVSQNVTLFNDTIAHNIAYGRFEKASEADIIQAAVAAHAMEFINELPNGLNTLIGENGVLLSGGQRQRLAIARAILKNAPILILDEATSALDNESERHIQAALEALMRNRTTLVIAHRLSTVEKADRILVVDKGHIVEMGTHQELLRLNGHYAHLYALQFTDDVSAEASA
jgi:subfamily B ATP-binding cassette protein MsbA